LVLKTVLVSVITLAVISTCNGQTRKNWKDQAEYILYSEIVRPDASPAVRLQNLDKWKASYPQSEFADTRLRFYVLIYQEMSNHRAAFGTAGEILKKEPNDLASVQESVRFRSKLRDFRRNHVIGNAST
jgi:hypothetical protein